MNDYTELEDQLWEAIAEVRDTHFRHVNDAPTDDVVAAILPLIREEIERAKVQALRDAAPHMHVYHDEAWLNSEAYEIEKGI